MQFFFKTSPVMQQDANQEKQRAAGSSVLAALALVVMKILVGVTTGSLGILAEAAHSGLDLVAAVVTFFAVRASAKPADREHRYGHGKVENLSAMFETVLLLFTWGLTTVARFGLLRSWVFRPGRSATMSS